MLGSARPQLKEIGAGMIPMSVFGLQCDPVDWSLAKASLHSTLDPLPSTLSRMSTVGEQLRQAREAQKLSLTQVAEITKIRSDHLQALEESQFDVFPAKVYVRGSVRTYCNVLKLDAPQILASLDQELSGSGGFSESPLDPRSRGVLDFLMLQLSKMDWRTSAIIVGAAFAALVIGCGYLFWRHNRSADPLKNLKPGVYQSTQSLSGQTLPLPAPRR